jgi:hypothetical protein
MMIFVQSAVIWLANGFWIEMPRVIGVLSHKEKKWLLELLAKAAQENPPLQTS